MEADHEVQKTVHLFAADQGAVGLPMQMKPWVMYLQGSAWPTGSAGWRNDWKNAAAPTWPIILGKDQLGQMVCVFRDGQPLDNVLAVHTGKLEAMRRGKKGVYICRIDDVKLRTVLSDEMRATMQLAFPWFARGNRRGKNDPIARRIRMARAAKRAEKWQARPKSWRRELADLTSRATGVLTIRTDLPPDAIDKFRAEWGKLLGSQQSPIVAMKKTIIRFKVGKKLRRQLRSPDGRQRTMKHLNTWAGAGLLTTDEVRAAALKVMGCP